MAPCASEAVRPGGRVPSAAQGSLLPGAVRLLKKLAGGAEGGDDAVGVNDGEARRGLRGRGLGQRRGHPGGVVSRVEARVNF